MMHAPGAVRPAVAARPGCRVRLVPLVLLLALSAATCGTSEEDGPTSTAVADAPATTAPPPPQSPVEATPEAETAGADLLAEAAERTAVVDTVRFEMWITSGLFEPSSRPVMRGEMQDGLTYSVYDMGALFEGILGPIADSGQDAEEFEAILARADELILEFYETEELLFIRAPALAVLDELGGLDPAQQSLLALSDRWGFVDLAETPELSASEVADLAGGQLLDPTEFLALLETAGDAVRDLGRVPVRGVDTTLFEADVSMERMLELSGADFSTLEQEIAADPSLDAEDAASLVEALMSIRMAVSAFVDDEAQVRRIEMAIRLDEIAELIEVFADDEDIEVPLGLLGGFEVATVIEYFDFDADDIVVEPPDRATAVNLIGILDPVRLLDEAFAAAEEGRVEDALSMLDELIDLAPADPNVLADAFLGRASLLISLGRYEEAVTEATAAIDLDPADSNTLASAYVFRVIALSAAGRHEDALLDATAAIELEPSDPQQLAIAYWRRGIVNGRLGRLDEALDDTTQAIEIAPEFGSAYTSRAEALLNLARFEDAIADATTAIGLSPEDFVAYEVRLSSNISLRRFEEALVDATALVERRSDAAALVSRSYVNSELGRFGDGVADATAALDLQPDDLMAATALAIRSRNLVELGRFDEAMADANVAVQSDLLASNPLARAHVTRSIVLRNDGELEESINEATTAIELEPPNQRLLARALISRSMSRVELGQTAEARADLETAIAALPGDDIVDAAAALLAQLG